MNTKTTSLPDTRAGEHKKTIEKSGIILMLLILVFLGMMSLDRSNKPENSGKDSASGVIATTSSETKNAVANSDLSDSVVPSEKVSTETESNGETDVGETTGYEGRSGYSELMSRYYGYIEMEVGNPASWSDIDGYTLYLKVKELKRGELLTFDIVYFDNNNVKHLVKTFKTTEVNFTPENLSIGQSVSYDYHGCFQYPGQSSCPEGASGIFFIEEKGELKISGSRYHYPKGKASPDFPNQSSRHYVTSTLPCVNPLPTPLISE